VKHCPAKKISFFTNCSPKVKIILFRSYCVCLYDSCLWSNYTDGCLSKLKLCYHKCIRMFFFGFKRSDSVTQILLQLGLPSFNTLIHNSRIIFLRTWTNCPNMLVSHRRQLGLCFLMYSFLAFYVYCLCVLCVRFMGLVPESNKWLIDWLIDIRQSFKKTTHDATELCISFEHITPRRDTTPSCKFCSCATASRDLLICRSVELSRGSNSSIMLANRLAAIYWDVFLPPATCVRLCVCDIYVNWNRVQR